MAVITRNNSINNGNIATSLAGASVMIIFNGRSVGTCTSASWEIDYSVKPIYGIDNLIPQEIMPTTYKVSFSLTGVRVVQSSLEQNGIIQYPGVNSFMPYISIAILERLSNVPLLNIQAAMIDSAKNAVSAKGLMTFDISGIGFVALSNSTNDIVDPAYSGIPKQMTQ